MNGWHWQHIVRPWMPEQYWLTRNGHLRARVVRHRWIGWEWWTENTWESPRTGWTFLPSTAKKRAEARAAELEEKRSSRLVEVVEVSP